MLKRVLRNIIYSVPRTRELWPRLHLAFGGGQAFSGWGMVTSALLLPMPTGQAMFFKLAR
jgi:hypothetical protein